MWCCIDGNHKCQITDTSAIPIIRLVTSIELPLDALTSITMTIKKKKYNVCWERAWCFRSSICLFEVKAFRCINNLTSGNVMTSLDKNLVGRTIFPRVLWLHLLTKQGKRKQMAVGRKRTSCLPASPCFISPLPYRFPVCAGFLATAQQTFRTCPVVSMVAACLWFNKVPRATQQTP